MTELDSIRAAFEGWCQKELTPLETIGAINATALFWPLLQSYYARQADPKQGVSAHEMRVVKELKAALGMELWAHEK